MGNNKIHATCLATLLQNELNSDRCCAFYHSHCSKSGSVLTGLSVGGKTRNNAIQLVLEQCCKTSCKFLLPGLPKL